MRGGLALGLMPRLYTASLRDPQLMVLPLARPRIERRVVLVYPAGPTRNEVAGELIAHLRRRLPPAPGAAAKDAAPPRKPGRRRRLSPGAGRP